MGFCNNLVLFIYLFWWGFVIILMGIASSFFFFNIKEIIAFTCTKKYLFKKLIEIFLYVFIF